MRLLFALLIPLTFAIPQHVHSRDFPEPIPIADPWASGGAYGDVAYHRYVIGGPHDSFSVRSRFGVAPFRQGAFAAGAYWTTVLLAGPVDTSDDPASIAEWWMNAIQFEYGIVTALRMQEPLRSITVEYGRTSQHPLRSGYSEVASDVVTMGLWIEPIEMSLFQKPASIEPGLRLAWVDLYDLWESALSRPRTLARLAIPTEMRVGLSRARGADAELVAIVEPRVILTRIADVEPGSLVEPRIQAEVDALVGIRFSGYSRLEIMMEFFTTADTEQVSGVATPLASLGVAVRAGTLARPR